MYFNGATCDIYIGKGAGEEMLEEIHNARKSVRIVSPYLSPRLISELIRLQEINIEVELITTDIIEDSKNERNIYKLIIQNRVTNEASVALRERWKDLAKTLFLSGIGFLSILIGSLYYVQDSKMAFGLVPITILLLLARYFKKKAKYKRIYDYYYTKLFPFKVYMSPNESHGNGTFIHSKIYLIDDRIAYMGSLNFTASGTKHNYETRIRTEDPEAIREIKGEINQLLYQARLPERDIQHWGRMLYPEPVN